MLRISNVRVSIEANEAELKREMLKKLNISKEELIDYKIFKESIDARSSRMIYFVYTIDVEVKNEEEILKKHNRSQVRIASDLSYKYVSKQNKSLSSRPIVIGAGPAGLFATLILVEMGYRPLLLERGKRVDKRVEDVKRFWEEGELNPESNVQFGEGGAGTFSDGKLTTRIKDIRCRKVLEELIEAGAPAEISYKKKAHIGTDNLRRVVKNLRKKILEHGGEIKFESKVTEIIIEDGAIKGVVVNEQEQIEADAVILAVGHSARDTFKILHKSGVYIKQKPFSIGVRIEHPQGMIDRVQYGKFAGHHKLGAADYQLSYHAQNGRSAYTFCMCPGGRVVAAASEEGGVVTNGMSEYSRDRLNANSALLVGVRPEDYGSNHPLAGVEFQQKWESRAFEVGGGDYAAPGQLVGDFLANRSSKEAGAVKPSYLPGINWGNLVSCLPLYVIKTMREAILEFDNKIEGFARSDAVMTGVETRSSSPIRIIRDDNFESNIKGLYPAGEGAGYAGGIISAAVDGIKVAEGVIKSSDK